MAPTPQQEVDAEACTVQSLPACEAEPARLVSQAGTREQAVASLAARYPASSHADTVPTYTDHEAYDAMLGDHRNAESRAAYLPGPVEVRAAAHGSALARHTLEIDWIDELPAWLRSQIEQPLNNAVNRETRNDAGLREFDEIASRERQRQRRWAGRAHVDVNEAHEMAQALEASHAAAREAHRAPIVNRVAQTETQWRPSHSAVDLGEGPVTHAEGATLARTNFMAWAHDVLGSSAAVRAHFSNIRGVVGFPGLHLHAEAGAALTRAKMWYEATFPGASFPTTSIGQALRGRHQAEHSRGALGHPLGIAVDFFGYFNPHQTDPVQRRLAVVLGGEGEQLGIDRLEVQGTAAAVQRMARDPKSLSASDAALIADMHGAFAHMAQTSTRLRNVLSPTELTTLDEIRQHYMAETVPLREAEARLPPPARRSEADTARASELEAQRAAAEATASMALTTLLAGPRERMRRHAAQNGSAPEVYLSREINKDLAKTFDILPEDDAASLAARPLSPRSRDAVARLVVTAAPLFNDMFQGETTEDIRREMRTAGAQMPELLARMRARVHAHLSAQAVAALTNPEFMFGAGRRARADEAGPAFVAPQVAAAPPFAQLLHQGFLRNDEQFNSNVIEAMLRHGWNSGATWDSSVDAMHFDFEAGYVGVRPTARGLYGPEAP